MSGLCTLAEVKQQLNITSSAQDTELQSYIDSITAPVEMICGPILPRAVTEWHTPGSAHIILRQTPIVSVTTLTEYVGTAAYTYAQATDPTGSGAYTFFVNPNLQGEITRWGLGGFDYPFLGRVQIVYQAGLATVPAEIDLAARLIVQHLWESQRGPAALPLQGGPSPVQMPGFPYAIPNRAKELLESHRRVAGIG